MSVSPASHPSRGFTLVELLVVIAILAILTALAIPVLGGMRAKASSAHSVSNLRSLSVALNLYAGDNDATLPGPVLSGQPARFFVANPDADYISGYLGFALRDYIPMIYDSATLLSKIN